jgi:hypothetical protein
MSSGDVEEASNNQLQRWKDSWRHFDSPPHFLFRFFPTRERVSGTP